MHGNAIIQQLLVLGLLAAAPTTAVAQVVEVATNRSAQKQTLLGRPARLQVQDAPLLVALTELSQRSGVPLAYSPTLLPDDLRVDCACQRMTVREALAHMVTGAGFSFREADGQIILSPRAADTRATAPGRGQSNAAPTSYEAVAERAEPATITGRVTSEGGIPVAAATVTLSRLQLSAFTNEAGAYRLVVPEDQVSGRDETLEVSRLGFRSASSTFLLEPGMIVVNITLSEQAVTLDEILVTGTAGNLERRAQPAVVATINAAQVMRHAPIRETTQLLESRVAGLSLTQSSGTSGAAARINIRGASSITLSNQPLVFIDGVRMEGGARSLVNVSGAVTVGQAPSALNDLNPADIESIEVVKGPAAATLYGADASAGVIQIITKRGRVGGRSFSQDITIEYDRIEPNFSVPDNYAACSAPLVLPDSPNPICRGREVGAIVTDNPAARIGVFGNGDATSVKYSARGGGDNFGYFASFGLTDEQGTTPNNSLKHRTGRVNFTFAPAANLTFEAGVTLTRSSHDLPRSDQDNHSYYLQSILGSPLAVRESADGSLTGGMLFATASLESMSSIVSEVTALRSTPTLQVRYSPTAWLSNRLIVGADLTSGRGFQMYPKNDFSWYPDRLAIGNGDISTAQDDDRQYTIDYSANIPWTFGADGEFTSNFSFGSQYIHRVVNRLTGAGGGLVTNAAILVNNTATSTVSQGYAESKALGLFVQEQIGYRDRLYVQLGMRADRNSAFGSDVGTFFLPKLGVSYVVADASRDVGSLPLASTLRVRGAWGTTGRSPTTGAALRTFSTARFVNDAGVIELGLVPGNPGNPDLKPERGTEIEFGADAGFLDDRIGAEVTFFRKTTTDLLVSVPVSPSSGFGSAPFGNIGEVLNSGVEFLVRGTPVRGDRVTWDVSVSGSTLHNEIVSLGTAGTFINNFRAFVPGRQLASWWVHRVRSVDQANGRTIVSDTAEFAGNQLPAFQANLMSTLTLSRTLSLYGLLNGKSGYYVYNLNQEFRDRSTRSSRSVVLGAGEGGYSDVERLRRLGPYVTETSGAGVGAGNVKDPYIQKGDHIRLQELSATVSLPTAMASRIGAQAASLTFGGRNIAVWAAEYEGDDPDVLGTGPQQTGVLQFFNTDVFTTPPVRRWILRMNLQF